MTKEEAIDFGKMWIEVFEADKDSHTYEFFEMAIEALERENVLDKIRAEILSIGKYEEYRELLPSFELEQVIKIIDKYRKGTDMEIHCNCTDEEIAKSFIEDVEAVKDLLPRGESEEV